MVSYFLLIIIMWKKNKRILNERKALLKEKERLEAEIKSTQVYARKAILQRTLDELIATLKSTEEEYFNESYQAAQASWKFTGAFDKFGEKLWNDDSERDASWESSEQQEQTNYNHYPDYAQEAMESDLKLKQWALKHTEFATQRKHEWILKDLPSKKYKTWAMEETTEEGSTSTTRQKQIDRLQQTAYEPMPDVDYKIELLSPLWLYEEKSPYDAALKSLMRACWYSNSEAREKWVQLT